MKTEVVWPRLNAFWLSEVSSVEETDRRRGEKTILRSGQGWIRSKQQTIVEL